MVKLNRIYTRTGDTGTSGLADGSRIAKTDVRMVAIGEVDEANSAIGVAIVALKTDRPGDPFAAVLTRVQNDLFDLGADLATPAGIDGALRIVASQAERLERDIDALNEHLAPLTSFVLPGGSASAAALHVARSVTRRAERAVVAMGDAANPQGLAYLNRLSDLLFCAARAMNQNGAGDVLWVPGASR